LKGEGRKESGGRRGVRRVESNNTTHTAIHTAQYNTTPHNAYITSQ
jgi:hypothetical protein